MLVAIVDLHVDLSAPARCERGRVTRMNLQQDIITKANVQKWVN